MTMRRATRVSRTVRSAEADQDEFRWFFTAEYPRVVRVVYGVVHDAAVAEEIAQESFIQLLNHWAKVSRYDQPASWTRRVAIRLAVRDVQRRQRRSTLERLLAIGNRDEPQRHPDPAARVDLMAAVHELPARQRAVVVLFYFDDRPMDEIADILGCAPATGWVHLHRARRQLAELLGEEDDDGR